MKIIVYYDALVVMEVILNKSLESINVTQVIDDDLLFREGNFQENSIPNWIIIFYFVVVSIGATINSVHVLALSRCSRNGNKLNVLLYRILCII